MLGLDDRLGERAGKVLAQVPHGLGDLGEGCLGIRQFGLRFIKPQIEIVMELLAQGGPLFACTQRI